MQGAANVFPSHLAYSHPPRSSAAPDCNSIPRFHPGNPANLCRFYRLLDWTPAIHIRIITIMIIMIKIIMLV
ncbi:hypothetical protein BH10PLA2_BH10PLA2_23280 [soil metagenome]